MIDVLLIHGLGTSELRREAHPGLSIAEAALAHRGLSCVLIERSLMDFSVAETVEIARELSPRLVVLGAQGVSPTQLRSFCGFLRESVGDLFIAASGILSLDPVILRLFLEDGADLLVLSDWPEALCRLALSDLDERGLADVAPSARLCKGKLVIALRGPGETSEPWSEPEAKALGPPQRSGLAGEWAMLTGLAGIKAAWRSVLEGEPRPVTWLREPERVAEEISRLARLEGIRRFVLHDAQDLTGTEELTSWLAQTWRGVRRRGADAHLALCADERALDPEFLASFRALGRHSLVVGNDRGARLSSRLRSFALARELGVRVVTDFVLFSPETSLDQVEADLGCLPAYEAHGDDGPRLFGRGHGRELYLSAARTAGLDLGVPTYDVRVKRLHALVLHLYAQCYGPLYSWFSRLARFTRAVRRHPKEKSLERLEPFLWQVPERVFSSMSGLFQGLVPVVRGEGLGLSPDVLDQADSGVARALADLARVEATIERQRLTHGIRYVCHPRETGGLCAAGRDSIEWVGGGPLVGEAMRVTNRLPRSVAVARLARRHPRDPAAEVCARLAMLEQQDSRARMADPPLIELPGSVLEARGLGV